jgi:hypothetical protein
MGKYKEQLAGKRQLLLRNRGSERIYELILVY